MSTTGRRGPTTRAASRASSVASSAGDDAAADQRVSGPGSVKSKRSQAKSRENKLYGSKLAAAGAQRMAAAAASLSASEGIQATLDQAEPGNEESDAQALARQLDPIQEAGDEYPAEVYEGIASRENEEFINQALGERIDEANETARRANGNQPSEGSSVLQKQITFLSSNTSIDRSLSSFFRLKHYLAIITFLLVLIALFADIYRGPLFGPRFDILKKRFSIGHRMLISKEDIADINKQIYHLEMEVYRLNKDLQGTKVGRKSRPINFFSQLHGMIVEAHLTSPTGRFWLRTGSYDLSGAVFQEPTLFEKYVYPGYSTIKVNPNGPATVFAPWDESEGPSWCAAAGDGKLQLAVAVDGPMTPTELVIEHNPNSKQLRPKIVPAPKEVELWAEILDDDLREYVGQDAQGLYGEFKDPESSAVAALPKSYVPIGRWTYNWESPEFAQTFRIMTDLKGTHVSNVAVRVNSNWANDPFTCLYRLRLHGKAHHEHAGLWMQE
ncbi:MAG: hypothetical protein L6R41_005756 [Letrouitia leprolyta]|nr:MAG: hypothetical protein L6R41_005756 [Letrouitia leprolyta]